MKFKKSFFTLFIVFMFSLSLVFCDSNGVWHKSEDVRGGVFGSDEQDLTNKFSFINPVDFNSSVLFNNVVNFKSTVKFEGEVELSIIKSNSGNGNVVIQLG